jgi:ubiquinol-cytochrome c reductase iron-sulfur subunit
MLIELEQQNSNLRDPDSRVAQQPPFARNVFRSIRPEYLVLVGLCTHLGCVPQYRFNPSEMTANGFYCPCHGSRFDLSGRVFKSMPAPINLAVPPYYFLSDTKLVIGERAHE